MAVFPAHAYTCTHRVLSKLKVKVHGSFNHRPSPSLIPSTLSIISRKCLLTSPGHNALSIRTAYSSQGMKRSPRKSWLQPFAFNMATYKKSARDQMKRT